MASFNIAHDWAVSHEGFYSNDPNDPGGETICGYARNYHPKSRVWRYIDAAKAKHPDMTDKQAIERYPVEQWHGLVADEYRSEYWSGIMGEHLPDQDLADVMYDIAVNGGVSKAVRYLQKALNKLNRYGKDYADLKVDGRMGAASLAALEAFYKKRGETGRYTLLMYVITQMTNHYISSSKEEYINGWGKRAVLNMHRIAQRYFLNERQIA